MILVDTNVILDVMNEDERWGPWSEYAIETHARTDVLVINPIIYAEVSVQFDAVELLEEALSRQDFRRLHLPHEAAFLAGKAFIEYKKRGGIRHSPLPDFFIGAHAQAARMPLLTRDRARYQTYFPDVQLITP